MTLVVRAGMRRDLQTSSAGEEREVARVVVHYLRQAMAKSSTFPEGSDDRICLTPNWAQVCTRPNTVRPWRGCHDEARDHARRSPCGRRERGTLAAQADLLQERDQVVHEIFLDDLAVVPEAVQKSTSNALPVGSMLGPSAIAIGPVMWPVKRAIEQVQSPAAKDTLYGRLSRCWSGKVVQNSIDSWRSASIPSVGVPGQLTTTSFLCRWMKSSDPRYSRRHPASA
jgi:hypothetical protein